jgi:hypothetical protein
MPNHNEEMITRKAAAIEVIKVLQFQMMAFFGAIICFILIMIFAQQPIELIRAIVYFLSIITFALLLYSTDKRLKELKAKYGVL